MYHHEVSLDTLQQIFDVMNLADWHIVDSVSPAAARCVRGNYEVAGKERCREGENPGVIGKTRIASELENCANGDKKKKQATISRLSVLASEST